MGHWNNQLNSSLAQDLAQYIGVTLASTSTKDRWSEVESNLLPSKCYEQMLVPQLEGIHCSYPNNSH